jgi:hypothetical protein
VAGLSLLFSSALALAAQVAGTVVHLSGALMAQKPDGTMKALTVKSEVESGDTLVSQRNTYAQIRMVDNSEITLRPNTTFKIENFSYDGAKPEADSASFRLVKGGLRSVSGLLGKRNREKFEMRTPTATIGIRGTTFVAQWVPPPPPPGGPGLPPSAGQGLPSPGVGRNGLDSAGGIPADRSFVPSGAPTMPPGLHLSVTDGAIIVTNNGGSQGFQAGQFGYVPSITAPPVIVPPNPNLQFTPPPSFQGPGSGAVEGGQSNAGAANQNAVDCEVR